MTWLSALIEPAINPEPVYGKLVAPTDLVQASQFANEQTPDPYNPQWQSDHIATMNSGLMPDDLPLPVGRDNGVFVPATGKPADLGGYDPWTWADPQKILDHSKPENDPYAEPSGLGNGGSIVAEWGGMPEPALHFLDQSGPSAAVLLVPRQVRNVQGPAGQFYGPQQTAWEASYVGPTTDYWSTIILQQ